VRIKVVRSDRTIRKKRKAGRQQKGKRVLRRLLGGGGRVETGGLGSKMYYSGGACEELSPRDKLRNENGKGGSARGDNRRKTQ